MNELEKTYWSLICSIVEGDEVAILALKDFVSEHGFACDHITISVYTSFVGHKDAPLWVWCCKEWINTGEWPGHAKQWKWKEKHGQAASAGSPGSP